MFSDAAIAAVLLASSRHFSRHFWSFAPLLRPLACLQAHSSLRRQQLVAHHPQIGQRKQRLELQRVLLQTSVAHLRVSKLPLDHPKGMLHLGPDAGLDLLHLSMSASMGLFSLSSSLRLPGRIATCQVTPLLASGRLCAPW